MKKEKKKFTSRKIARDMARFQMKRAGFTRINRQYSSDRRGRRKLSPFSRYWREFAVKGVRT